MLSPFGSQIYEEDFSVYCRIGQLLIQRLGESNINENCIFVFLPI